MFPQRLGDPSRFLFYAHRNTVGASNDVPTAIDRGRLHRPAQPSQAPEFLRKSYNPEAKRCRSRDLFVYIRAFCFSLALPH